MNALPPEEQRRFLTTAMIVNVGGDKDSCWFGKTLFTGITALPTASRVALMQSLATKQPPPGSVQARRF
jgi:hypothetical protein